MGNDRAKSSERFGNNGECDPNVNNEINKELKLAEDRVIYGICIEEKADRKK